MSIFPSSTADALNVTQAYESLLAILDAIDALVYVADMESYEIYFLNAYGRKVWGEGIGKQCWAFLQSGQKGPCEFCTNPQLIDAERKPTGVLVWEFQNTANHHWYQCRDQAITWMNGRLARIEIATDITDLKNSVQKLEEAKQLAEALSRTDELTGIRNRRALMDDARMLFNLAKRYHTPLMMVVLDLDFFKRVNDQHGHRAGDDVLVDIAKTLHDNIREVDVLGRFGGEEFVLVLPGIAMEDSQQTLNRLREIISGQQFKSDQGSFSITCSMGACQLRNDHDDIEELLHEADKALYRAKNSGRNRVEYAGL